MDHHDSERFSLNLWYGIVSGAGAYWYLAYAGWALHEHVGGGQLGTYPHRVGCSHHIVALNTYYLSIISYHINKNLNRKESFIGVNPPSSLIPCGITFGPVQSLVSEAAERNFQAAPAFPPSKRTFNH